MVHIPLTLRERCTKLYTLVRIGLNDGLPGWTRLDEAFAKLIFSKVASQATYFSEVKRRLELVELGLYEEAIQNIRGQVVTAKRGWKRRKEHRRREGG